jgi:hypothetical protein
LLAAALLAACEAEQPQVPAAPVEWSTLEAPVALGSAEPRLTAGPDGAAVLSWLEPDGEEYVLKYSVLGPTGWGAAVTVARGADFFVNSADLPSVQPISADLWAAHWLVSSATSRFAYDIAIATSVDGGRHWGQPRLLNDDGTDAEHGFVTLFAWDGDVGAVWLDGRELAEFHEQDPTAPELETTPVGTNLRFARLAADGTTIEQGEVDRLACDCCQTAVVVTERGPLVAYRDRTDGEIRDIVVRTRVDGGWTEAQRLAPDNWQIEGCPVNGPALASKGREIVAAWFTAAGDRARVLVARSIDAGANFAAAVEVDTDGAFGHVDVALTRDGAALVSWWRRSASGGTQLSVRRVESDGTLGPIQHVAKSQTSRPVDFPQMVESGQRVVVAWTETSAESESVVKTAIATF